MTPRLAAIVTCHNLGRTLLEALRSIEHQTRPAAEIVVVDDRSTDLFTRQMLARLEREGTRVVRGPGRGASAARNLGATLTTSEYLMWLDADDTLEPGYFEAAGARLDASAELDFVSCAQRAFGEASFVWSPATPTFVEAVATGGVPHASTVIRRQLWETVGGFDEDVPSFELLDFWTSVIELGFRGIVLEAPLLNYRIRAGSGYRRSIQHDTYLARMKHFYAKHHASIELHGLELLQAKEAFFLSQRDYWKGLESRAGALHTELAQLMIEIGETAQTLGAQGIPRVDWGEFRRREPLRATRGPGRGQTIDRYYIERFLDLHRADIRGSVLEVADLVPPGIPDRTYDCVVLTGPLQVVGDVPSLLAECARILRSGGVLLATAPCVVRGADDGGRDEDFWRLTEASARKIFEQVFPVDGFEVSPYGNVMASAAQLYGLAVEDMSPADLDHVDPACPVLIAIRAVKPASQIASEANRVTSHRSGAPRSHQAVILAYHRIASLTPDAHALCTPPDVFRAHMAHIARTCSPVSLEDLVAAAASDRIPKRAVAVTLDDGYLDALTVASAILRETGVPATFFVNTDRLDEEHERWWDILEHMFTGERVLPAILKVEVGSDHLELPTSTQVERGRTLERLSRLAWPLDAAARLRLLTDVLEWGGGMTTPRATHRILTGDEIRELGDRPGHAVGAHSVHHLALTTQPAATKRREILESKAALERLLHRPVHLFSYPYGDFDADSVRAVSEAGFRAAVTIAAGTVTAGTNRLLLPRCEVTTADHDALPRRLQELFEGTAVCSR